MASRNGFPESSGTRTAVARRPPELDEDDVLVARRGAASFGGGDPSFGELIRDFVRRYGWRAYALPILVVVTIAALLTARSGTPKKDAPPVPPGAGAPSTSAPTTPPLAEGNIPLKDDTPGDNTSTELLKRGQLPAGPVFTKAGTGTFSVMQGTGPKIGTGTLHRYDIEVEDGITGVDVNEFANMVQRVLTDQRSWTGHGVALQRVAAADADFHISLTSPMTVRQLCGYTIQVETSCFAEAYSVSGLDVNRVVLNVARWVRGAAPYVGDLNAYRTYMINHEDGHAIDHGHAHQCLPDGLAPVMMQQTFGLTSAATGKNCQANPWPYPTGVQGTPGDEQPDTDQNNEYNLQD